MHKWFWQVSSASWRSDKQGRQVRHLLSRFYSLLQLQDVLPQLRRLGGNTNESSLGHTARKSLAWHTVSIPATSSACAACAQLSALEHGRSTARHARKTTRLQRSARHLQPSKDVRAPARPALCVLVHALQPGGARLCQGVHAMCVLPRNARACKVSCCRWPRGSHRHSNKMFGSSAHVSCGQRASGVRRPRSRECVVRGPPTAAAPCARRRPGEPHGKTPPVRLLPTSRQRAAARRSPAVTPPRWRYSVPSRRA